MSANPDRCSEMSQATCMRGNDHQTHMYTECDTPTESETSQWPRSDRFEQNHTEPVSDLDAAGIVELLVSV